MTHSKKVVIFLLTVMSCLMLIGGETNYTAAEKKFVCNFWETQLRVMKEIKRKSLSQEVRIQAFKKMLHAGDIAILSPDCPKDFRQHWQFFSTNVIPAMNLFMEIWSTKRPITEKEKAYFRKIDNSTNEMQRIYDKCK